MKKLLLLLSVAVMMSGAAMAKDKKHKKNSGDSTSTAQSLQLGDAPALSANAPAATGAASTLKVDDMVFNELTHDFGTVEEGPDATTKFTFMNKGGEAIVVQKAQASCGCTVPSYSNTPVNPGTMGTIDVAFHTKGKPAGPFTKTITVTSNAGTRVLTIKGSVEKAPTSSVPENTSMIKTN